MSNDIISKWLGECRHENFNYLRNLCRDCETSRHPYQATDYENDESAWTQEVYGKIEEAELKGNFVAHLIGIVFTNADEVPKNDGGVMFALIKSTPAQKSLALSRAIEEVS